MSIEAKSKKIMKDNIVRLAKEYSMPTTNVQLVMQFKGGQPKFYSAKDFVKDRELGVKELYPVLVDIFNVRDMIPVFIGNLLVDVLKECDAEKEDEDGEEKPEGEDAEKDAEEGAEPAEDNEAEENDD